MNYIQISYFIFYFITNAGVCFCLAIARLLFTVQAMPPFETPAICSFHQSSSFPKRSRKVPNNIQVVFTSHHGFSTLQIHMLYSSADFRHNLPWLNGQMQMCSACAGCWWIPTRNRLNRHISLLLPRDSELYCFQSLLWDWMISHPPVLVCRAVNKSQRRPAWLQTSHNAQKSGERFKMSHYQ